MSWQSQFDARGPRWDGNAAAVAEEKRLQKLVEEQNRMNIPIKLSTCEPSVLEKLDQEMHALHEQERKLLQQLDQCSSAQEKVRIEDVIRLVRRAFGEVKSRYVQLRESRM